MRTVLRWLFRLRCEVCGHRDRRCARWHIEVFTCRVCGRDVDENDMPAFNAVVSDVVTRALHSGPVTVPVLGGMATMTVSGTMLHPRYRFSDNIWPQTW